MENILNTDTVQILDEVSSWQEAIKVCAKPLLVEGNITENYISAMIDVAERLGPFYDFGKNVAVPHSRSEDGVNKKGIALLKLNKPINLLDSVDHPISIFIVLAAEDNTSHVCLLKVLSEVLIDDEKVEAIKNATTKKEILDIFNIEEDL